MKITITHNGFHGYTSRTINVAGNPGERVELSESQIKKLSRAACGMSDCTCGENIVSSLMRSDCNWYPGRPVFVSIPEAGDEITLAGNHPQNR